MQFAVKESRGLNWWRLLSRDGDATAGDSYSLRTLTAGFVRMDSSCRIGGVCRQLALHAGTLPLFTRWAAQLKRQMPACIHNSYDKPWSWAEKLWKV